jgi:hypothetical protein
MSITFTTDDYTDEILEVQQWAMGKDALDGRRASLTRSAFRAVSVREMSQQLAVLEEDGEDEDADKHITPTSTEAPDKIDKAYDQTTLKGKEGGLFRACMAAIRSSHHEARQIRTALILLGLFTDKSLYREWLCVFYAVNYELEKKMKSKEFEISLTDPKEIAILRSLKEYGATYYFSDLYEQDLEVLYGKSGSSLIREVKRSLSNKPNALRFCAHVEGMKSASELAGALFCLWGVFIVGGGAMARQRAQKMCGEDAVNVYQNVAGPGREKRKKEFIVLWDSIARSGSKQFQEVANSSDVCMKMMNATIKDLNANPWWLKWLSAASIIAVAIVGVGIRLIW